jgi:hypothetical protein
MLRFRHFLLSHRAIERLIAVYAVSGRVLVVAGVRGVDTARYLSALDGKTRCLVVYLSVDASISLRRLAAKRTHLNGEEQHRLALSDRLDFDQEELLYSTSKIEGVFVLLVLFSHY